MIYYLTDKPNPKTSPATAVIIVATLIDKKWTTRFIVKKSDVGCFILLLIMYESPAIYKKDRNSEYKLKNDVA